MMITPREALKAITDDAFAEGQNAAEVFWQYTPAPLDPKMIEDAQDNVVEVVVKPFADNPHFAQLPEFLNAIRISAWDGFERRWRELKNEGPRPLDAAMVANGNIPDDDLVALQMVADEEFGGGNPDRPVR